MLVAAPSFSSRSILETLIRLGSLTMNSTKPTQNPIRNDPFKRQVIGWDRGRPARNEREARKD
jgi:hypothetical protein